MFASNFNQDLIKKQKLLKMNMILICISLQFVLFTPFYLVWRNDCKEIGKEHLAVSLTERFISWILFCPIWIIPFIR